MNYSGPDVATFCMRHRRRLLGDTPTPFSCRKRAVLRESWLPHEYSNYSPLAAQGTSSDPGSVSVSVPSKLICTS